MKSNKNESIKLIESLSNAKAPSGFEDEAVESAKKFASQYAHTEEDCLRNLYINLENNDEKKPIFMLDAHGDEVGMIIHSIKPNGTLRFLTLGGWNPNTLPSSRVMVRNKNGKFIPGIIAAKPVHFMTEADKNKKIDVMDMVIDVGAVSDRDAIDNFGIRIGEPAVSYVKFSYDEDHDIMIGKGFDCRIGCAAMLETMKRLKDEKLDFNVCGVMSSQEEVGERGVHVAVNKIKPNVAICFEGCPADDTFTESYAIQTAIKKGPMIRFIDKSIIVNPRYMQDTIEIAEKKGIKLQTSVRSGGGNNGAVINLSNLGVPVIVIGIPVRYIHSHYGIAAYEDFESSVELAVEVVKNMSVKKLNSF